MDFVHTLEARRPWSGGKLTEYEKKLLGVAEEFHVLEALRPAEQRADGEDQDVFERVQPGALDARIGHPKRVSEPTLKVR